MTGKTIYCLESQCRGRGDAVTRHREARSPGAFDQQRQGIGARGRHAQARNAALAQHQAHGNGGGEPQPRADPGAALARAC